MESVEKMERKNDKRSIIVEEFKELLKEFTESID